MSKMLRSNKRFVPMLLNSSLLLSLGMLNVWNPDKVWESILFMDSPVQLTHRL